MLCPFPGMDPYIQEGQYFSDLRFSLTVGISAALQPLLRPKYAAFIRPRDYRQNSVSGMESLHEPVVHIIEPSDLDRPITIVEVVGSDNKIEGSERALYREERQRHWQAGANLVEIDLLRTGQPTVRIPFVFSHNVPASPYIVAVNRTHPHRMEAYPIGLRDPLPKVAIPLGPADDDVTLDLQAVFQRNWIEGPYVRLIQYDQRPPGPLSPDDWAWCLATARSGGLIAEAS